MGDWGGFHDTVTETVLRALAERSRGGLGTESNTGSVMECNVYKAESHFRSRHLVYHAACREVLRDTFCDDPAKEAREQTVTAYITI